MNGEIADALSETKAAASADKEAPVMLTEEATATVKTTNGCRKMHQMDGGQNHLHQMHISEIARMTHCE